MGTKVSVDGPCACCDIILTRSVAFGCESYSIGITNIKGQPFAWLRPTFQGCFRHLPTFQILNVEIGLTIWLFNSSPWKDLPIFKFGKPSISMGHGLTMAMLNNQKVTQWFILHFNGQKSEDRLNDLPYQSLAAQDFPMDLDMVPISSPPRCPLLFFGTAAQQRLEHRTMSLSRQGLGSFKNGVYQINHHWMRKIWWFAPVALGGFHGFPTMFRNLVKWSW